MRNNGTDFIEALVQHCRTTLDLASAKERTSFYQSLPLCVIDTVFSINATYTSTENTVVRFSQYANIPCLDATRHPPVEQQLSINAFLELYATHGVAFFAETIYQNRQRTSTTNGILKAEAVQRFASALADAGVQYLQDAPSVIGDPTFEQAILAIPGQRSGVSLRYFYMLIGSDAHVKPDRMIRRFIYDATGRDVTVVEAHDAIVQACQALLSDYPALTPARLDNMIWNYQRTPSRTIVE